jgi:hypothetical protein
MWLMNSPTDTGTLSIPGPFGPAIVARPSPAQVAAVMRYVRDVRREQEAGEQSDELPVLATVLPGRGGRA